MGYSCGALEDCVLEGIRKTVKMYTYKDGRQSSNVYHGVRGGVYMFEIGRENPDGAITGTISRFTTPIEGSDHAMAKTSRGFRIEAGKIIRFTGMSRKQMDAAEKIGVALYKEMYVR